MERDIKRITYEGIDYILGATLIQCDMQRVPYPYVSVTNRSSRKNRDKKPSDKNDGHFQRISVEKPIPLFRECYRAFEIFLADYDMVCFSAYDDDQHKRERIYKKALENMGFRAVYEHTYDRTYKDIIMAREGTRVKRKDIKKLIDSMGG
jgi:hypothetical protein